MNKQELLKQADYTFQRGNRELAKKYLTDYLSAYSNDETAWMLMAKMVENSEQKAECYRRVLKINANNNEAKIGLGRVTSSNPTLPLTKNKQTLVWHTQAKKSNGKLVAILIGLFIFTLFGATTLVLARNNPQSKVAQILAIATPTIFANALADDIAPQTRAEVNEVYPQYAPLVDALIGFAVASADNGMEGAPTRPGNQIIVSEQSGLEAKSIVENALPQTNSLTSITITEQQVTSWLVMEMSHHPDLPVSDVQVFLRNGQIQIWGMINGSADSTSALVVGEIKIDNNQQPYFVIESMQVGTQSMPNLLLNQGASWLNQMLAERINEQMPGLKLMNINVVNGLITVSGMR